MKLGQLLIAALLLALVLGQESQRQKITEAKRPFSAMFAASWLGGFCFKSGKCDAQSLEDWDRESFTIHGLWPNPRATRRFDSFDVSNIHDEELLDDMNNYWPANSKPSDPRREYYWLWEHEYDKHGVDFAHLVNIYQPEVFRGYNTQKLQEYFFAYTINFYKNQKLQKIDISKGKDVTFNSYGDLVVTKQSLGQIIDIDTDHFTVACNRDWLLEIKICIRIHEDLSSTYENCRTIKANNETPYSVGDNCPSHFRLIGYKRPGAPSQDRVTANGEFEEEENDNQEF